MYRDTSAFLLVMGVTVFPSWLNEMQMMCTCTNSEQARFDFHYRQQMEKAAPLRLILNTMKRSDYKIWWITREDFNISHLRCPPLHLRLQQFPVWAKRAAWQTSREIPAACPVSHNPAKKHILCRAGPCELGIHQALTLPQPASAKVLSCLL